MKTRLLYRNINQSCFTITQNKTGQRCNQHEVCINRPATRTLLICDILLLNPTSSLMVNTAKSWYKTLTGPYQRNKERIEN